MVGGRGHDRISEDAEDDYVKKERGSNVCSVPRGDFWKLPVGFVTVISLIGFFIAIAALGAAGHAIRYAFLLCLLFLLLLRWVCEPPHCV